MRRLFILATLATIGCASVGTPAEFGITPMPMPSNAPDAFTDVVKCANLSRPPIPLAMVAWHVVDRQYIPGMYGGRGMADVDAASIYLVRRMWNDRRLLAHELAHIELQTREHPAIFKMCGWMDE